MVKCGNLFITYKGLRKNDELKITIFRAFSIIFDSERAFVSSDQAIQIYINIISTKTKLHLLMILFIIINRKIPIQLHKTYDDMKSINILYAIGEYREYMLIKNILQIMYCTQMIKTVFYLGIGRYYFYFEPRIILILPVA